MTGWLSERGEAFQEARESRGLVPVIFAGALIFLGFAWSTFQHSVEKGSIWGAPVWAWGLIVGFAFLIWWLFETVVSLRRPLKPKVKLSFVPDGGGIIATRQNFIDPTTKEITGSRETIFVRIRVECISKIGPRVCAAFLTGIEKTTDAARNQKAVLFDPLSLPWSQLGIGELPIYPQIPRNIDLVLAAENSQRLEPCFQTPFSMSDFVNEAGIYDFNVNVVADGVPEAIRLRVHWNGDWRAIRAEEVA